MFDLSSRVGLLALLITAGASAAELRIQAATEERGTRTTAILHLHTPGEIISALQLDLAYANDNVRVTAVEAHESATGQDKTVEYVHPQPGVIRLLLYGQNRYPLLNGPCIIIRLEGTSQPDLRILSAAASDPDGGSVPLSLPGEAINAQPERRSRRSAKP